MSGEWYVQVAASASMRAVKPRTRAAMQIVLPLLFIMLLVVAARPAGAQRPEVLTRAPIDPSAGVNFHALATPDTVWVGQQVHYQVGVFMDEDVRSRLRRNPEFMPPELRAMLAYDLPDRKSVV